MLNQNRLKQQLALLALVVLALQLSLSNIVRAADSWSAESVIINEIAWAGSSDTGSDEWIELYNPGPEEINLSGWYIEDDGDSEYLIESGIIKSHGYFLIEDNENAVGNLKADAVIGLSLANSGDSLILKDNSGSVIDSVNINGGSWTAGDSKDYSSMERVDEDNWASALMGNGSSASKGSMILGTPGSLNSNFEGDLPEVIVQPVSENYNVGGEISFIFSIKDIEEVLGYGFDVLYNAQKLEFSKVEEGDFLNSDEVTTSFFHGLENGQEGKLVIGNARIAKDVTTISGDGVLFNVTFKVKSALDDAQILIGPKSFLAGKFEDLPFKGLSFDFGENDDTGDDSESGQTNITQISSLNAQEAEERYGIKISWQGATDSKYQVRKKLPDGNWQELAATEELFLIDDDNLENGGNLIPQVEYEYEILVEKEGVSYISETVKGKETRGIKGDNNRDDRVDGRDLTNLAKGFGYKFGEENYLLLLDTDYDGFVDGSDLIDIGANFGIIYEEGSLG